MTKTLNNNTVMYLSLTLVITFIILMPTHAFASEGSGGGLPYEDWLEKLRDSVTGPVAFTLALIGIVVAGSVLIFGGDISGFFRTLMLLVLVMAFLVGAQNMMSSFFGKGAEIALSNNLLIYVEANSIS
jgi:type IV secretory pathway VirB2 component (pilin)